MRPLSNAPGYNAESTITRDGKHIVFTSTRNGDIDIYTMDADGSNVKQLTHELGYDGGPFWSYDGKKIVYRARTSENARTDQGLQSSACARADPSRQSRIVGDECGRKRQASGDAQWRGEFRSLLAARRQANRLRVEYGQHEGPRGFDLYVINEDGTGLERITYYPGFDAFPMFSSDGKRLVWASNRNGTRSARNEYFHRRLGSLAANRCGDSGNRWLARWT